MRRPERKVTSAMLLPAKAEVARHLEDYRAWERLLLAAPADQAVRGNFENAGYTLCVLMAKRCAREAVDAAEDYLRGMARTSAGSPASPAPSASPVPPAGDTGSTEGSSRDPHGLPAGGPDRTTGRCP